MVIYNFLYFVTHKMSFMCIIFLILCCHLSKSIKLDSQHNNNTKLALNSYQNETVNNFKPSRMNSTIQTRQGRDQKYKGYFNPARQGGYSNPTGQTGYYPPPSYYGYGGPQYNDMSTALESPLTNMEPYYGEADDEIKSGYPEEAPSEANDEEEEEPEEKQEVTTVAPEAATTLAPFTLADVKVPAPFLRIEYMISFTFFGVMYGLGFFVLFQSLCVPAAKIAVYIVYMILLKLGSVDPVTLEQALEQLPPT